jgi:isopenicillin-N epimerase
MSRKQGFHYRQQPIPLPAGSAAEIVEQFWKGVTSRTRVIFLSHITSPTALKLPVADICHLARQAGILTVIDGAHAPGQIQLDLGAIDADFYTANAHKWMCAPKGSAFLYTRQDRQHLIEPLVVSWGWGDGGDFSFGSPYLDYLQWSGTNDPAAYLSVPAAIQFQATYDWPAVRQRCQHLALQALHQICEMTGLPMIYQDEIALNQQMVVAPLPLINDLRAFKSKLYEAYRVEVPFIQWQDRQLIRISVQAYNTRADIDALCIGLERMLAES